MVPKMTMNLNPSLNLSYNHILTVVPAASKMVPKMTMAMDKEATIAMRRAT